MEINTTRFIDGAKTVEGLAVVIDVFRASSTITTVVADGGTVIPVETVEDAIQLQEEKGYKLAAERDREKIPGADFNNSPSVIADEHWTGETLILSTSAGTKVLHAAAQSAENTVIGCFLNTTAIQEYVEDEQPDVVTVIAAGVHGEREALEDEMCAAYLGNMIRGNTADFDDIQTVLYQSEAAQELRSMDLGGDVEFCLRKDVYQTVPVYNPETGTITPHEP